MAVGAQPPSREGGWGAAWWGGRARAASGGGAGRAAPSLTATTPPTSSSPVQALSQFGTDFTLMERVFPGRARRALKNKFNRECRADGARVDQALKDAASGGGALESYQGIIALLSVRRRGVEGAGAQPLSARAAGPRRGRP